METVIPVICENSSCGRVFFTPFFLQMPIGSTAELSNNKLGPCPSCGGMGLVPGGLYTQTATATIFAPGSEADRLLLERALQIAKDAINGKISFADAKKIAEKEVPGLNRLWQLMPRSKQDTYSFWQMVLLPSAW